MSWSATGEKPGGTPRHTESAIAVLVARDGVAERVDDGVAPFRSHSHTHRRRERRGAVVWSSLSDHSAGSEEIMTGL